MRRKVAASGAVAALNEIGEFGLIKRIAGKAKRKDSSVLVGIGDDAAVITPPLSNGRGPLLVTTDSLVEDIHFRKSYPPDALGWKALAVNLSDIAAMGGIPEYYLLSISIPKGVSLEYLDKFFSGMDEAARKYGLSLIGGDTTSSPDKLYISITLIGKGGKTVLLRKGARPGDVIFVTGTLGDSALGLKILEEKGMDVSQYAPTSNIGRLINRHLRPIPRVKEGTQLAKSGIVTSMIDISDGLLSDLGHICEESKAGARIWLDKLPLSRGFKSMSKKYGGTELSLSGGEDYELLFTVRKKDVKKVMTLIKGTECTPIGEILKERLVEAIGSDGGTYISKMGGYEHFRR